MRFKEIESCIRKKDKRSALIFLGEEINKYLDMYTRWSDDSIKGRAKCDINKHKDNEFWFCPLIFQANLFRCLSQILKIKEAIEKEDWERAERILNIR